MRKRWMIKTLPAAILLALGATSLVVTAAQEEIKTARIFPETDKPVVHSLSSKNMLELLSADNTAQLRMQQKEVSNPWCDESDYFECDERNASVAVKFSRLQLSGGAYLEVFSREDAEVLRYDAGDIAKVTKRTGGTFTTPYIKGDNLTLRLVYPQGTAPGPRDSAVTDTLLTLVKIKSQDLPEKVLRKPVACLKNGSSEEQQLYSRSQAVGYAPSTAWLVGTGNHLLTNNHVLGGKGEINAGDFIPDQSVRFSYESPDCADNKAAGARDNLVNIRAGQLVATGGNSNVGSGNDWTLFTLDPLEYREAAVKTIFGGLALDSQDMQPGQEFSAVGHGRERQYGIGDTRIADPQQGSARHVSDTGDDGHPCSVHSLSPGVFNSNCYVTGGNSGSPAFSGEGKVTGMIKATGGPVSSVGLPVQHLRHVLSPWAEQGEFTREVTGTGHARSAYIDLPAFARSSDITFKESSLSFAPVVEGRQFTHKSGYSLLKSVARDNHGREVDILFRLAQDNACGVANLASTCGQTGPTTLKVWLDRDENATSIPEGNSITGWLPVAVKSQGTLIANQMLRYRYTHYIPQKSPFAESGKPVKKLTLTNGLDSTWEVMNHRDFRSGITAVRNGEGPLADTAEGQNTTGVPYSGTTKLFAEVINQQNGQRYAMTLRGGLINSCTKKTPTGQGGWAPMNSSACEEPNPGTNTYSIANVFMLEKDNIHLPAGRYTGLLPLMARNWDTQETQPIEINIDYQMK